jgi:hypothetical protein
MGVVRLWDVRALRLSLPHEPGTRSRVTEIVAASVADAAMSSLASEPSM